MTRTGVRQRRLPGASEARDISLPAAPISCRMAREFVHSVIGGAEDPRVALVVTELVANAVVHAHAEPHLRVDWDGRTLNLEVEDDGPGRPVLRDPNPLTPSGRGLTLVNRMADDWGVEGPPDAEPETGKAEPQAGKVVWARIRLID